MAVIAAVIIAGSVAAGYVLISQGSFGGQPSKTLEFLSGAFSAYPFLNGTGDQVSALFFVENIASKPIISLTASIAGLPTLQFDGGFGHDINTSRPLYPNESTHNIPPPGGVGLVYQSSTKFTNGTQYSVTFSAMLSDGTVSQLTQNFTFRGENTLFSSREYLPSSCSPTLPRNDTFPSKTLAYSVDNSSKASWTVAIGVGFSFPAASISVGVNNGTIWFPLNYNGKPVSPANPLLPGANITQTFTWTQAPGHAWTRSIEWVGTCAEENVVISTFVKG